MIDHRIALALAVLGPALASPARAADGDPVTHVMRPGDNLYRLAARYMVDLRSALEVQRINRVRDPHRIPAGSRIVIPRRLLRFEPVDLRVATFSGPVTVQAPPEGARPVAAGQAIAEGAELVTGPSGFVTLAGRDGTRLSLPSQSAVRVVAARRYLINSAATIDLEIVSGRASVHAPRQGPAGQFRLRTPAAVTAVRGTDFRVGYSLARETGFTEVLEGLVEVQTASRQLDVAQGFGATASLAGDLQREALLPAPRAIDPGRVQTDARVAFAFQPQPGAAGYRVQLARDAGFTDLIAETKVDEPAASLDGVGNGRLFMSASAIAASGLEGVPETWSFRRQRVGLKAEAGAATLPGGLRFDWLAEGEGTPVYRFQLFRAGDAGTPLIDEQGLTRTGITITRLPRGAYTWRVGVVQITPEGSAEVWTPAQTLTVSD